jgi:sensor histidine kinase YesM
VYPLIPRQDQFEVEFFQVPIEGRTEVMNFLWPRISLPVLGRIFVIALLGTVIAGTYGVLHDQVTFTISPEYFTKFKIHQFHYLGEESGSRIWVAKIGFLATWWVGFFAGWFMGRILVPRIGFRSAFSFSLRGFLVIFLGAFVGGLLGFFGSRVFPNGWESIRFHCAELGVSDVPGFVRVAWIHNAGYLGALLGLIGALLWIHRKSGSFSQIA